MTKRDNPKVTRVIRAKFCELILKKKTAMPATPIVASKSPKRTIAGFTGFEIRVCGFHQYRADDFLIAMPCSPFETLQYL